MCLNMANSWNRAKAALANILVTSFENKFMCVPSLFL